MNRIIFFFLMPLFGMSQSLHESIHLDLDDGLQQVTVWTMAEDYYHRIWLGNPGGIQVYDGFDLVTLAPIDGSMIKLHSNDSVMYCITTSSLYQFNLEDYSYTKVDFPQSYYYLPHFTKEGIVLYDTDNQAQFFYDYRLGALQPVPSDFKIPEFYIEFHVGNSHFQGNYNGLFLNDSIFIASTYITHAVKYDTNRVFVGTHTGLIELTNHNGQLKVKRHFNNLRVKETLVDFNKNLWVATADNGVYMVHRNTLKTSYFQKSNLDGTTISCWGFCEINDDMYVASLHGLIPVEKKSWEHDPVYNQTKDLACYNAITGTDFILIGTRSNGVYRLKNNKLENVFFNPNEQLDNIIVNIKKNDKGFIAATKWSMIQFNHHGEYVSQKLDDYDSLYSYTMGFYPFSKGIMNARTTGAILLDSNYTIVQKYKNPKVQVISMLRPYQNSWWGVSLDAGLLKMENNQLVTVPFPDKRLFTLTNWNDTNLWIGGVKGIYQYSDKFTRPFTPENGFPMQEYNQNAICKDSLGFIWVGGISGVHKYHPDSLTFFPSAPTVILSRDDAVLNSKESINLNFDQSEINLQIQLVSLSDRNLFNVEVSVDTVRKEISKPQQIRFSVPYGKSVIQVKITDTVHQVYSLTNYSVYRSLPFWKQPWFWVVSGIVLFLLVMGLASFIGFVRTRKQNQLAKIRIEEQQKGLAAVIKAQEDERKRIAKDLHDGIVQQLGGVKLGLLKVFANKETDETHKVVKILDESTKELRELSHKMMPRSLGELGLLPALADMLENSLGNTKIQFQFEHFGITDRFSENVEITIYRIAQELINNVIKHSGANNVNVQLFKTGGFVILIVEDNGKGIIISEQKEGIGLLNISSRLDVLSGKVSFEPSPESGTLATVKIPLS